jgi:hypothetical protein
VLALLGLKPSSSRTVLPWHPASRFDAAVASRDGEFDFEKIYSSLAGAIARQRAARDGGSPILHL